MRISRYSLALSILTLSITFGASCAPASLETAVKATSTPVLTRTVTPMPVPTPVLPVLAGTPLPPALIPITPGNAEDLIELAAWTNDALGASHWNPDGDVSVSGLTISPDNTVFISHFGDPVIRVWDLRSGQPLDQFEGHVYGVTHLALSADGSVLASSEIWDTSVWVWDVEAGRPKWTLGKFSVFVRDIALSPYGALLAASGDAKGFTLFDVRSGEEMHPYLPGGNGCQFAFSADGTKLASVGFTFGDVYVWDTATGEQLLELDLPGESNGDIAFAKDGQVIAIAGFNGPVWLVDAATGEVRHTLVVNEVKVYQFHRSKSVPLYVKPRLPFVICSVNSFLPFRR